MQFDEPAVPLSMQADFGLARMYGSPDRRYTNQASRRLGLPGASAPQAPGCQPRLRHPGPRSMSQRAAAMVACLVRRTTKAVLQPRHPATCPPPASRCLPAGTALPSCCTAPPATAPGWTSGLPAASLQSCCCAAPGLWATRVRQSPCLHLDTQQGGGALLCCARAGGLGRPRRDAAYPAIGSPLPS